VGEAGPPQCLMLRPRMCAPSSPRASWRARHGELHGNEGLLLAVGSRRIARRLCRQIRPPCPPPPAGVQAAAGADATALRGSLFQICTWSAPPHAAAWQVCGPPGGGPWFVGARSEPQSPLGLRAHQQPSYARRRGGGEAALASNVRSRRSGHTGAEQSADVRSWRKETCDRWTGGPVLTDAVEKIGRESRRRNNRIGKPCNLNQRCAGDWIFESKLRCGALKIFFQQYRPGAEISRTEPVIFCCTNDATHRVATMNNRCSSNSTRPSARLV
jgi:hypothetical protein